MDRGRTSCWNSTILVLNDDPVTLLPANVRRWVTYLEMFALGSGVCGCVTDASTPELEISASAEVSPAPMAADARTNCRRVRPPMSLLLGSLGVIESSFPGHVRRQRHVRV